MRVLPYRLYLLCTVKVIDFFYHTFST